jgi:hypothetical protein
VILLAQATLSSIRYWRIVILWIAITLIPTAVVSIPVGGWLSAQLDHSAYAGAWARAFDVTTVWQLLVNSTETAPALQGALLTSLLLTLLFSPLLTGMVVAAAKETRALGFVPLVQGGMREYGRMLRTLLWAVVPLGIAGAIGAAALLLVDQRARAAILESQVSRENLLALTLFALLFIVAHVSVEAGRAQFALDTQRRSAVKAWLRGVRFLFARPIAAFGSYLLITAIGSALVALLAIARINAPPGTISGFLLSLALTQLIAVAAIWMRITRLMALIQIARRDRA